MEEVNDSAERGQVSENDDSRTRNKRERHIVNDERGMNDIHGSIGFVAVAESWSAATGLVTGNSPGRRG